MRISIVESCFAESHKTGYDPRDDFILFFGAKTVSRPFKTTFEARALKKFLSRAKEDFLRKAEITSSQIREFEKSSRVLIKAEQNRDSGGISYYRQDSL